MSTHPPVLPANLTIAEVERDTGLGKDTLRVWERRYGFPTPTRDAHGERVYTQDQVDRLRSIRRLMLAGNRPGKLVALPPTELQGMLAALVPEARTDRPVNDSESVTIHAVEQALHQHDSLAVKRLLLQALSRQGLGAFVIGLMAPLTTRIGLAWMNGELQVFEEHLFTEVAQSVLRQAIQGLPEPAPQALPRVLLTTLPGEAHGLGLLMAEAMCALEACACISLGVQTPVDDIARAARLHRADVVGLSATGCLPARQVLNDVTALRQRLPESVVMWLGGSAASVALRRPQQGVQSFADLHAIAPAVQAWRGGLPPEA